MTVNDILITNDQVDAAFAVVQQESGWSLNKIDTVRRMVEAALRAAPSSPDSNRAAEDEAARLRRENDRLRKALEKIAFITGGIDTPSTSNAAHYEAVNALSSGINDTTTPIMVEAIRAYCNAADLHLTCSFPECKCKAAPVGVRAVLALFERSSPASADTVTTNEQVDAAFAVAQDELRWSLNKIAIVRRMVEAALRAAPSSPVSADTLKLARKMLSADEVGVFTGKWHALDQQERAALNAALAGCSPASGDTIALADRIAVAQQLELVEGDGVQERYTALRRDDRDLIIAALRGSSPANIQTLAADVLERNVTIAKLLAALKLGREAVAESFDHATSLDDQMLAEGRLRDIDDALAAVERPIPSDQPQRDNG